MAFKKDENNGIIRITEKTDIMIIYLDNCTFNLPYDNQKNIIVMLETIAKLHIQNLIKQGFLKLTWSYILEYENEMNPYEERKITILDWKNSATINILSEDEFIRDKITTIEKARIFGKDAVHIACAIKGDCLYFITTDYHLIRKGSNIKEITIINPIDFLKIKEEQYENQHRD
ncbi:MAG: PIN domain protein [Desulfobacterales bacterium]|nr:PIN domain protein [Desulfobacterales bacterium]MBF0398332.1 PIN domain protein [Desulfobacterales bacterium]